MKDPNFEPIWFYLLDMEGSWVANSGFINGVGSWEHAKRFNSLGAARAAIKDPSWHNDPDGVRRAKPVRISASIKTLPPKGM